MQTFKELGSQRDGIRLHRVRAKITNKKIGVRKKGPIANSNKKNHRRDGARRLPRGGWQIRVVLSSRWTAGSIATGGCFGNALPRAPPRHPETIKNLVALWVATFNCNTAPWRWWLWIPAFAGMTVLNFKRKV
jgi:hypothetical protein